MQNVIRPLAGLDPPLDISTEGWLPLALGGTRYWRVKDDTAEDVTLVDEEDQGVDDGIPTLALPHVPVSPSVPETPPTGPAETSTPTATTAPTSSSESGTPAPAMEQEPPALLVTGQDPTRGLVEVTWQGEKAWHTVEEVQGLGHLGRPPHGRREVVAVGV